MTYEDQTAAMRLYTEDQKMDDILKAAQEPHDRTDKSGSRLNVGGLYYKRQDGREPNGAIVADYLLSIGGTLYWDVEDPVNGKGTFDNIYQLMAAAIFAPGGTVRERVEASQEHENDVRTGVSTLAKWMYDQFGAILYRTKLPNSGNLMRCITVDPEKVCNPDTGETASQLYEQQATKGLKGQAAASLKKLAVIKGEDQARLQILEMVRSEVVRELPRPRRD
jgi:hypothetical protein